MSGWIKLHRKIINDPICDDEKNFYAWCRILIDVNHTKKEVIINQQLLICERGESLNSLETWGDILCAGKKKRSKSRVKRFFNLLEKSGKIETVNEKITTRLRVCNYETYQDQRNGDGTETLPQAERRRNGDELQTRMNKNDKNEKEGKNINRGAKFFPPTLEQVLEYCKEKELKTFDGEAFWYQKESNGWMNGKNKMKSWQSTIQYYYRSGFMKKEYDPFQDPETKTEEESNDSDLPF